MKSPNWIELAGVVNMRDLAGLRTDDGDVVAPRRLLRSDNLQDLPADSVRTLVDTYDLTDVVDLRTDGEVAREGDGPLRAVRQVHHHHFTLYREDSSESGIPLAERALPWELDERDRQRRAERAAASDRSTVTDTSSGVPDTDGTRSPGHDAFWTGHYLSYLEQRPDSVLAALRTIADSTGAAVVHCAAGKDRTGTVVGLALKAVGVIDDEIIADFAASAERVPRILERLRTRPAYAANLRDKTVAQQSPTSDTMRLLLAALEEQYGGAHGWLAAQDWTLHDTDRLRRKLLAP